MRRAAFHAGAIGSSEPVNFDAQFNDLLAGFAHLAVQIHRRDKFAFSGAFPRSDQRATRAFVLRHHSDKGLRQPSLREQVHRHAAHTRADTGNDFPKWLRVARAFSVGEVQWHSQSDKPWVPRSSSLTAIVVPALRAVGDVISIEIVADCERAWREAFDEGRLPRAVRACDDVE